MYLALPLCFVLKSPYAVLLLVLAGMAGALAWRAGLPVPGLWRLDMLSFVPCFLGGVLAYALLRRSATRRIPAPLTFAVIGALLAAFCIARMHYESFAPQWAFCLALGVVVASGREIPESVLSRVAHVIARYSYGVYLLHQIALWIALVAFGTLPPLVQWVVFAVLMIALPWTAYDLIERPGIDRGAGNGVGSVFPPRGGADLGRRALRKWLARRFTRTAPSPPMHIARILDHLAAQIQIRRRDDERIYLISTRAAVRADLIIERHDVVAVVRAE